MGALPRRGGVSRGHADGCRHDREHRQLGLDVHDGLLFVNEERGSPFCQERKVRPLAALFPGEQMRGDFRQSKDALGFKGGLVSQSKMSGKPIRHRAAHPV
jgi:hypothetical protein